MEPYAAIGAYYDIEHDEFTDDLDWYLHLASIAGPRIIELGSGSGRILGPLAAAGHHVVGLDSSETMLRRARTRLQAALTRGDVELIHGDMLNLENQIPGSFDLAILSLNSLMHLDTPEAQRRVLHATARVLRPGGLLAVDLLHAVPDALAMFDARVVHEGTWEAGDEVITKYSARTADWTNQHIASEIWYDVVAPDGALRRTRTEFPMRWISPAEISLMLELAGFADWSLAGGYDGAPLTDASDRMLIVARTPEGG